MSCLKNICSSEQNSEKCLAKKWEMDVCLMGTSDKCFSSRTNRVCKVPSESVLHVSLDAYFTEVAQPKFWLLPYTLAVLNGQPWHSQTATQHSHNPQNNAVGWWRVPSCSHSQGQLHQAVFQDLTQGAQSVQSGFSLEDITAAVFKHAGAEEVPRYRRPNPISATNTGI